jgi:hypothetical protein
MQLQEKKSLRIILKKTKKIHSLSIIIIIYEKINSEIFHVENTQAYRPCLFPGKWFPGNHFPNFPVFVCH